jgi:Tetratricopeptide repeat
VTQPDAEVPGRAASRQVVHAAGGFAYGVVGADLNVFQDRGPVYLLIEHDASPEPDATWLLAQPSRMLNARFQIVGFTGRSRERAQLTAWRDPPGPRLAAIWLHAPGGQGKTRLAAEFAKQSAAAGWKVVTVAHGQSEIMPPPGSVDMRLGDSIGLLLVLDYADRWPLSHLTWLFSNALLHHAVPTRLLLLARSVQPWPAVRSALDDLQIDTSDLLLLPVDDSPGLSEREMMFTTARDCFAARYNFSDPNVIEPPGSLQHPDFGLTLALHMAALVAVDAHARGVNAPNEIADMSAYLLDRERKQWTFLYERGKEERLDYQTPPRTMAQIVFAAALTGATTHSRGAMVLRSLDMGHIDGLLVDHALCYPSSDATTVLEPLYPDRLAEDFLALTLPGHTSTAYTAAPWAGPAIETLITRGHDGSAPAHLARTVTFLAAAAGPGRWPHVAVHLAGILLTDPELAVVAGGAALTALADIPNIDPTVLDAIEPYLPPERHVDLDVGIAAFTKRLTEHRLTTTTDPAVVSELHATLSRRLNSAGMYRQALTPAEDALKLRRQLAQVNPAGHLSDLAKSLLNLGMVLTGLGQDREALAADAEAVAVYRRLMLEDPAAYESDLADALYDLAVDLTQLGQYREALAANEEAVAIRRRLIQTDPAAHEPDLANALSYLAEIQSRLKRDEEAFGAAQEAIGLHRRLARANPAFWEPGLARGLSYLAEIQSRLKRDEEAFGAAQEAIGLLRRLAQANPAFWQPGLARALTELAGIQSRLGRDQDALTSIHESVTIYRQLVRVEPAGREAGLAWARRRHGIVLSELQRHKEALAADEEAVAIRRRLAQTDPAGQEASLAAALYDLAFDLTELGRHEGALAADEEVVAIRRRLAQADPVTHEPGLAEALYDLAVDQRKLGRHEEALAADEEAVAIRRRLAQADPPTHEPGLAPIPFT